MTSDPTIRVILIDDHHSVHKALVEVFSYMDGIELVAQGTNGIEAINLCKTHNPDIVLMDMMMPEMGGVEATQRILHSQPHIKILALSSFRERDIALAMLKSGAVGYILKDSSMNNLEDMLRTVYTQQKVVSPEVMTLLLQTAPLQQIYDLTERQLEVLKLLAAGMTNGEIAAQMEISVSTVKFHIVNIMEKLGAETRAEALVIAAKNKLI